MMDGEAIVGRYFEDAYVRRLNGGFIFSIPAQSAYLISPRKIDITETH